MDDLSGWKMGMGCSPRRYMMKNTWGNRDYAYLPTHVCKVIGNIYQQLRFEKTQSEASKLFTILF